MKCKLHGFPYSSREQNSTATSRKLRPQITDCAFNTIIPDIKEKKPTILTSLMLTICCFGPLTLELNISSIPCSTARHFASET